LEFIEVLIDFGVFVEGGGAKEVLDAGKEHFAVFGGAVAHMLQPGANKMVVNLCFEVGGVG
jgi:hypothetical protein